MKNKLIFICILLVSFLLILISCRKKGRPCDVNYKIGDILIPQNIEDSINETKYDAIQFKIYTRGCYYVEEIRCELPNGILIDSYKSIIIITLNKYNLTYDSLDTISNNFKIEYLKPDTYRLIASKSNNKFIKRIKLEKNTTCFLYIDIDWNLN